MTPVPGNVRNSDYHRMGIITRISVALLVCAAVSATASPGQAQGWGRQQSGLNSDPSSGHGGGGLQGHRPPKPPIDTALDANGDDIIDAAEIANAHTAITALDTDGDGFLSFAECLPQRPGGPGQNAAWGSQGRSDDPGTSHQARSSGGRRGGTVGGFGGHRPPQPPLFTALDTDGDGQVGADEIAAAPASLSTLDRDGDGSLSAAEYRPPRPGGRSAPAGEVSRGGLNPSR